MQREGQSRGGGVWIPTLSSAGAGGREGAAAPHGAERVSRGTDPHPQRGKSLFSQGTTTPCSHC